jgi:hypothetical protein
MKRPVNHLPRYREPERMNAVVNACLGLAAVFAVVNLFVTLGQVTRESPRIAQTLFAPPSCIAGSQTAPANANLLTNAGQTGLSLGQPSQTNQAPPPAVQSVMPVSPKARVPG